MYDEPPEPQSNPCPMCEGELGYTDGCPLCTSERERGDACSERDRLKTLLGHRVRQMLHRPFGMNCQPSEQHMLAVAMLVDLAGLKLPEEVIRYARANVTGEYGEYPPYQVTDEQLVERFLNWAHESRRDEPFAGTYTAAVLDARPATEADQLWAVEDEGGFPMVATHVQHRLRYPGGGTQWGATLRERFNDMLRREARGAAFWLEFYRDYLRPPKGEFKEGMRVSYVVGVEAYTAHVGDWSEHRHRGFGGHAFRVRLTDGRELFTNDNWGRGTVPPDLRKLITANAIFLPDPKPDAVAAAGVGDD